jgi:hypothetical protein
VWLEASHAKTLAVENSNVADLVLNDGELKWTQTDNALPLPLNLDDAMIQFVLGISGLDAMDRQTLRVDGLPAARYSLKIDGHAVASLTREQWAAGVNLALYATPMESQAKSVDSIELKRTRLDETNFIVAVEPPALPYDTSMTKALEQKDIALQAEQREAAQPKPHRFELSPQ